MGEVSSTLLTIIVVHAPWQKAQRMAMHLLKRGAPRIPRVRLSQNTLSAYHRTQTTLDRICTVETVAVFLKIAGESEEVCTALVDMVRLNNAGMVRPETTSCWAA